jgi:sugar lactone lactonase YvrE
MREREAVPFATDFLFLEAPRWRDDLLWISDVFAGKVYTLDASGNRTLVCDVPQRPAGLGFLPDGTPIIVSMRDRKLLKLKGSSLHVHADLSTIATGDVNDFVIDERGRIYVGNFGYDFHGGAPQAPSDLHLVEPDGAISVAATDLEFPNGAVLLNAGRTLVVAETWSCRLTAFDRDVISGKLSNRRVYADLETRQPDGICVDAAGAIWACSFNTGEILRVLDGGEITDRIACAPHAISCVVGGKDGKTLYFTVYAGSMEDMAAGKPLSAVYTASA